MEINTFSFIEKYRVPVFFCVHCDHIMPYNCTKQPEWRGRIFESPVKAHSHNNGKKSNIFECPECFEEIMAQQFAIPLRRIPVNTIRVEMFSYYKIAYLLGITATRENNILIARTDIVLKPDLLLLECTDITEINSIIPFDNDPDLEKFVRPTFLKNEKTNS